MRFLNRGQAGFLFLLLLLSGLAVGCVDELEPIDETTSLRVTLLSPTDVGSFDERIGEEGRTVELSIEALDASGQLDTRLAGSVDLFVHYLGGLTPPLESGDQLVSVEISEGVVDSLSFELPLVFGPSFLWAENARGDDATFATGTSDVLWFRDPYLADVQRPEDEASASATDSSPLENKQVNVTQSRYGSVGRMVVTGVYAQGYTLSDSMCQDDAGTPPCVTDAYDSIFVYSFSRAEDEEGRTVELGHVVSRMTGGIGEFNGLTEVNFPQTFIEDPEPMVERIPEPAVIQADWLTNRPPIEMERVEAALIAMEDATVCELDSDFTTYAQWKVDIGNGCGSPINVITKGQVSDFDPAAYVGVTLPRVVGTLRPVNIGTFNVWIVYPRTIDDITLP